MNMNLHSTMGAEMVVNNNLLTSREIDDVMFILDFSSHYLIIANLFNEFNTTIKESVSKMLLENMVIEYVINPELEGGMFWENMRESIIFDLGEHQNFKDLNIEELLFVIDENYELLDVMYGEIYGKLTHAVPSGSQVLPVSWTGDGDLNKTRATAKITLITNPDLILSA